MSVNFDHVTISIPRRLLEHPEGLHIRRMKGAIWLYLALLAQLPKETDTLEVNPKEFGERLGLPEGTIRSLLGHLRKGRHVEVKRLNGTYRVRVKRLAAPVVQPREAAPRLFTVAKLERALGDRGNRSPIETALAAHDDQAIQKALAGALAVPAAEIRRSRTALFLYLLKRHAEQTNNHPRA
jgi:hypothetical protein